MKKIFILLVLLFPSFLISYSQNWQESYDTFLQEFQEQKFDKVIQTGEKTLNLIGQKDTNYLVVLRYMAFAYYSLQDYDKAVDAYKETQLICRKLYGKNNYTYILVTYNLAVNYTYIKKYSLAYPLMEEVIDFIINDQGKNSMDYINIANQQANIYSIAGSYDKAEEIYNDVFEVIKSNYKTTDTLYMQTINVIAPFYVSHGMFDKAEPFYTGAVDLMDSMYGKKSKNYIASLNSLGEFYILAGMYTTSEKTFQKYVDICAEFYGKNSANYATALNNLAVTYEKQGKNIQAEDMYLQTLKIKEKVFNKESDFYALTLSNLGVLYENMGKIKEAEQVLEQALEIYKTIYGETNPNYAVALNNMASIYSSNGKYKEAIELTNKALEIQKGLYGEKYAEYVTSLNNLAMLYENIGDFDAAEKTFEKSLQLRKEIQGENHNDYAITLYNIGNIKMNKGDYVNAEKLLSKALAIQKKVVGEYHASYANTLNSLAGLYSIIGNFQLAEITYNKCKMIFEKVYGDMHPEYAAFLNNFGEFYLETGNYDIAEELLNRSLKIEHYAFGKDHPDNVNMLSNLANNMIHIGNNKKAEEYLLEAVRITKVKLGIDHPVYASSLLSLGVFYYQTGNYSKSEKCYLEVLEKYKKIYGEKNLNYSTILNNIGALYLAKAIVSDNNKESNEWTNKAVDYFTTSLKVDSISIGMEHSHYAAHLNNLAELYRNTGQFEKAEPLYLKSIEIEKKTFGEDYPDLAVSYHNLALLYNSALKLDKAEEYCLKALKLKQSVFGENNPVCSETMFSLAYIYESANKYQEAEKYYTKAMLLNYELIKDNFSFLSESEKENYLKPLLHYNDMYISFAMKNKENNPSIFGSVYNNELINKGILLQSSNKMKNAILNSNEKDLIEIYNKWIGTKQQLSKLYSLPAKDRFENTDTIEEQANILEKELVSKYNDFNKDNELFAQDWTQIKKNLKETDATIEFIRINCLSNIKDNTANDSILYAALIIRPNYKYPQFIPLCNETVLQKMVGDLSWSDPTFLQLLYKSDSKKGLRLYNYIWEPIESSLVGVKNIYFSPVGIFNQISFAAIPTPDKKLLSDIYNLNQLTSTRIFIDNKDDKPLKFDNAVVYGGIQYDGDNLYIKSLAQNINIDETQLRGDFNKTDSVRNDLPKWNYLKGTAIEANNINDLLKNKKIKTSYFTGYDCLEEKIKENKTSPSLIHIATHGFSFPMPDKGTEFTLLENSFVHNLNPLFRTGLLFAGANRTWKGIKPLEGIEDGVLTAYEISNLNLSNTKLVVLSACETGLGELKGNEGVYGLLRAFKMAGVKYIVMSLWQVPDAQTVELMEYFYKEMLSGKPIREAFRIAQNNMKLKYDSYYWAAFVLVE